MLAFYDNKPSVLEAVGDGSYKYRFDITEKTPETIATSSDDSNAQDGEQRTQWQCEEVTVWSPVTSNKITEAVITEVCDHNYEQKLVNEYNAAQLGLYGSKTGEEAKKHIDVYTEYLNTRAALKAQIDTDCAELGIL